MRLLPWLANPGKPAMSPQAEGKKGTHHTDIIYTVETREVGGNNLEIMQKGRTALQQMHEGIHILVDNRGSLTAQGYQHFLKTTHVHWCIVFSLAM